MAVIGHFGRQSAQLSPDWQRRRGVCGRGCISGRCLIFDGVLLSLSLSLPSPNCPITSLTFENNQLNHNPSHRVTHLPPLALRL